MARSMSDRMQDLKRQEEAMETKRAKLAAARTQMIRPLRSKMANGLDKASRRFLETHFEQALSKKFDPAAWEELMIQAMRGFFLQVSPANTADPSRNITPPSEGA